MSDKTCGNGCHHRAKDNVLALQNTTSDTYHVVGRDGEVVLSYEDIRSIAEPRMIRDWALDYYVINCVPKDPGVFIMNTAMTATFLRDGTPDQILNRLKRFQRRHGMKFLGLDRVIFVTLSASHYNIVSYTKFTVKECENGYHLKVDCSLGKEMKAFISSLLYGLKLLYEDENDGAEFPLEQWRCPQGRGTRRSESQASNGLNCGVFAAHKVECLAKGNRCHRMTNELAPYFRKYMISRIHEVVSSDPNLVMKEGMSLTRKSRNKHVHEFLVLDGGAIDLTEC